LGKQDLSFEHQNLIEHLCTQLDIPLSEYNFANLYLFRKVHNYTLDEVEPSVWCIKGVSYYGTSFLMPLFHPHDWETVLLLAQRLHADYLFPIPEKWTKEIEGKGYSLEFSPNDSDYIFDAERIRTYRGRHLDGQRNLVRNLRSEHTVQVHELTSSTHQLAFDIIDTWEQENRNQHQSSDVDACREGVLRASDLGLQGWIYTVDGKNAGLLIGGPLSSDTYIYHFSKATLGFRGLSALMHQDAASRIEQPYHFLNWEQDLGVEGLRYAKKSFHPLVLAKKWKLQAFSR
jgi:hypothetical protein